jgi:hypothetical protein
MVRVSPDLDESYIAVNRKLKVKGEGREMGAAY